MKLIKILKKVQIKKILQMLFRLQELQINLQDPQKLQQINRMETQQPVLDSSQMNSQQKDLLIEN